MDRAGLRRATGSPYPADHRHLQPADGARLHPGRLLPAGRRRATCAWPLHLERQRPRADLLARGAAGAGHPLRRPGEPFRPRRHRRCDAERKPLLELRNRALSAHPGYLPGRRGRQRRSIRFARDPFLRANGRLHPDAQHPHRPPANPRLHLLAGIRQSLRGHLGYPALHRLPGPPARGDGRPLRQHHRRRADPYASPPAPSTRWPT